MSERLYHAATDEDWGRRTEHHYEPAGYPTEGFVHCSSAEQLPRVLAARYRGRSDLRILTIDPGAVTNEIVWEDLYDGGEDFPHLYGPVELAAVVSVRRLRCDQHGDFDWTPQD